MAGVDRSQRVEWSGRPSVAEATRARVEFGAVLVLWGLPEAVVDDAVLVAAELLDNVVQHAHTSFRLVAELKGKLLHLAVDDELPGRAPPGAAVTVAGHVGGLRIVGRTATRWGWREHDSGKTVWAEFFL